MSLMAEPSDHPIACPRCASMERRTAELEAQRAARDARIAKREARIAQFEHRVAELGALVAPGIADHALLAVGAMNGQWESLWAKLPLAA